MNDYISREAALQALCEAVHAEDEYIPCRNQILSCQWKGTRIQEYAEKILAIPAADVRPVVRGEWEKRYRKNRSGDYVKLDRCSVCGEPIPYKMLEDITEYISGYQANFCPNCGADMRKEDGTDNV